MLQVHPTANLDDIKAVLSHPVIWDAITVDGQGSPEDFKWSLYEKWLSVGGYVDGKPIAIMFFHNYADGDKVHIQVLPDYRKQYAREFGERALKYAQFPVYADIPDMFPSVQRFTESFGFMPIASADSLDKKNGQTYKITRYARYQ